MTDAFCGGCNRIRLTAAGQLRNCLFGEEGWDLLQEMRGGASDGSLAEIVSQAVQRKHAKLGGKRDMFELRERGDKALPMIALAADTCSWILRQSVLPDVPVKTRQCKLPFMCCVELAMQGMRSCS
eukprot:CAMPEP_0181530324 /NCGR_PEP_ID=MMETSP1110-20121109/71523_1 /TAXON_ID=174948 /ORGANISM="Symbiodinium sp., Strain CCMP421" /LENGTH=125 /DNA_ID=CAMNT_0023661353 /DNA_START=19 /DNA_END=394 /DNA_ORIENTATION=+